MKRLSWRADARLYRVEPPYQGHDFLVVSAAVVPFTGAETYIFAATAETAVTEQPSSWLELGGSSRGTLSHAEVLNYIGYVVTQHAHKREGAW